MVAHLVGWHLLVEVGCFGRGKLCRGMAGGARYKEREYRGSCFWWFIGHISSLCVQKVREGWGEVHGACGCACCWLRSEEPEIFFLSHSVKIWSFTSL